MAFSATGRASVTTPTCPSLRRRTNGTASGVSADVDDAVTDLDRAAAQGDDTGERHVRRIQAGDLREDTLRPARHAARVHVVLRAVPRAHQATVPLVDAPPRQVGEQVPAAAGDRKQLALRVSN